MARARTYLGFTYLATSAAARGPRTQPTSTPLRDPPPPTVPDLARIPGPFAPHEDLPWPEPGGHALARAELAETRLGKRPGRDGMPGSEPRLRQARTRAPAPPTEPLGHAASRARRAALKQRGGQIPTRGGQAPTRHSQSPTGSSAACAGAARAGPEKPDTAPRRNGRRA